MLPPFLRTIDDSTSTIKGHFRVSNRLDASDFALFTISSIAEQSGYFVGLVITFFAGYIPAKKAAQVDPVTIFRK